MPWPEEQARLTQEARLSIASPEEVYRELREIGKAFDELLTRNDEIEVALIERNQPLINLGLACFGTNKEVYKAIYKHSLEPPRDATDAQYKRGLRIGCLSNESVKAGHPIFLNFPQDLIGDAELDRILTSGDTAEAEALLCNPSVSANLLEELYTHAGPFANIEEERWGRLVYISRKNERIGKEEEYPDMPDMEHYGIHKAIFRLLETAPLKGHWLRVLYGLLDELNFRQTHSPEAVEPVLTRWARLDDKSSKGEPFEGYFTSLSLKDEFRCLVASTYGRTYSNSKSSVQGSLGAKDVAMRCAYYGNAELTDKELREGYKRDDDVFVFAAMNNNNVLSNNNLRKIFEEDMVGDDNMTRRYLRNFELKKKEWPNIESYFSREFQEEIAPNKEDARMENLTGVVTKIDRRLDRFAEELKNTRYWLIVIAIAIAVALYFKH